MSSKVIHIVDQRTLAREPIIPRTPIVADGLLADTLGRPLRDLRISLTDRCNFRCIYCMPKAVFTKDHRFLPHHSLLSFEEIARIAKIFVAHGVRKIRLTGGEPLLRKDIERLVEKLSMLETVDGGAIDLTLTTNGALLAKKAQALKSAGLRRVSVSMDALDDTVFRRMNDADFPVAQVMRGIDAAHAVGLGPIKVNMVVKKGINDREILPMARHFKGSPFTLRFIEFMDVGSSNDWTKDEVVLAEEIARRIHAAYPLEKVPSHDASETAQRWAYRDGSGEIGIIASVSQPFCGACSRARLSPEGRLFTCLFATHGYDLRAQVRNGRSDGNIAAAIAHLWHARKDRYSEERSAHGSARVESPARKIEMSYIGG